MIRSEDVSHGLEEGERTAAAWFACGDEHVRDMRVCFGVDPKGHMEHKRKGVKVILSIKVIHTRVEHYKDLVI